MKLITFLSLLLCTSYPLLGQQPGMLDPSFFVGQGPNQHVFSMAALPNGKVLVGGRFDRWGRFDRRHLVRLNKDGTVDPSFVPPANLYWVRAILPLPDGKVLVADESQRLRRLLATGAVDDTFNVLYSAQIKALARQPDGKLVVGGEFDDIRGEARASVARLEADGTLDFSFVPGAALGARASGGITAASDGGSEPIPVRDVALQADGSVIIVGGFTSYGGVSRNGIARLTSTGAVDPSFDPGAGADGALRAVKVDVDGKIYVAGSFSEFAGHTTRAIARLSASGSVDVSFTSTSIATTVEGYTLHLLPSGKVLLGGEIYDYGGVGLGTGCVCLMPNGLQDASFRAHCGVASDFVAVNCFAAGTAGKVLLGGWFNGVNDVSSVNIASISATGVVDPKFGGKPALDRDGVTEVVIQRDGKILVGGRFNYGLRSARGIVRLNKDGTQDTTFNPGSGLGGTTSEVYDLALQPDGKVLLAGRFTQFNGTPHVGVVRLLPNGTLDASFDAQVAPATATMRRVEVLSNGKIIIAGNFTSVGALNQASIARLNSDGTADATYTPALAAVTDMAVQPDGKVLVTGFGAPHLKRLNADGTDDAEFNANIGTGSSWELRDIKLQPDGKILGCLQSSFSLDFNGRAYAGLFRLNADGTTDASFSCPLFANIAEVQPDGKILIGTLDTLARVHPNGSRDESLGAPTLGLTFSQVPIMSLALQTDGKALVAGQFRSWDADAAVGLTRIFLTHNHAATKFSGITQGAATSKSLIGAVSISLTKTGTYTGSVTTVDGKLSFSGAFDASGESQITPKKKDNSLLYLTLNLRRGAMQSPVVSGSVADSYGRYVTLEAHAPFFSAPKNQAVQYAGKYHVALEAPFPGSFEALLPVSGVGYFTAIVATSGKVSVTGKAADGTSFTASTSLSQTGGLLLHLPLYKSKGYINGVAEVHAFSDPSYVGGSLHWIRPPDSTYSSGIDQAISAYGTRHRNYGIFAGETIRSIMGIDGGHLPVRTGPGLESSPLYTDFNVVGPKEPISIVSGNMAGLKMVVNAVTGTFSGTFLPPGAIKPVAIAGVTLSNTYALGFCLINQGGQIRPSTVRIWQWSSGEGG